MNEAQQRPETGAQVLVRTLEDAGVEFVFGFPGGTIMPVYDALYDSHLKHILCRHEQGVALAADGYARSSGKLGVCMATSGPGATNLVTGIANAFMDSVPMLAITGQVPTAFTARMYGSFGYFPTHSSTSLPASPGWLLRVARQNSIKNCSRAVRSEMSAFINSSMIWLACSEFS